MRLVPKVLKKVAVTTALSTCLVSSFVTPAFAAIDASSLNNKIGNELQAEFNVTEIDHVDTVVLSWDAEALNTNLESFDLLKGEEKTVAYHVSPGADNDDDLTVSVLLKIPDASLAAIQTLEVNEVMMGIEFSEPGFSYYVVKEGLAVIPGAGATTGTFDIAFNAASAEETPFAASLIAVKENVGPVASIAIRADLQNSILTYQHQDMILYLRDLDKVENDGVGTLVVELGELTPTLSEGKYGIIGTETSQFDIIAEYYDETNNTFTIPVPVGPINFASMFRLNEPTYGLEADSTFKVKFDQDGDGTDYTFGEEVTVTYTLLQS